MKRLLLFFSICSFIPELYAQQNNTENLGFNPPNIKWRKIEVPTGKVIYPEGLDSMAARIAGIMNYQRTNDASIVGSGKTKAIPVILQPLPVFPEGFSTPAPWRSEYFVIPPQHLFFGPTSWTDLLTIHEYRHTQQFHMAKGGFTWMFKPLMGQTGWLLNTLFNQPLWFREGDAVVAETQLTKAGRGRMPRFHMETKALLLSNYKYNYEKAAYGISLKNFVPNPYRYGYYMTSKLRKDLDENIWQRVLDDTYDQGLIYSFKKSLERNTGLSPKQLYEATMAELDSNWRSEDARLELTTSTNITKPVKNNYVNYRFPHFLSDGSLLVLKDAFDEIRTFTTLNNGREKKLFSYGIYSDDHLMYAAEGNLLTWAEATSHPRWGNKTYSIVKVHNLKSGKTKKLTRKTRYFAPAPSHDGSMIVAVNVDLFNKASLVILDSNDGAILKTLAIPANTFIAQPRWSDNDQEIIAVLVIPDGNSLVSIDVVTGKTEQLLATTAVPISRPYPKGKYIFLSVGITGIDNIYALEKASKQLYQVTSVRFGAYEPAVSANGQELVYSSYTAEGYQLEQIAVKPETWKKVEMPEFILANQPYVSGVNLDELTGKELSISYQPEKFQALTYGLFNVYGWFPFIGEDQYGMQFLTQNIMNTLRGSITPFYNTYEDALGIRADLSYAAFYPVLRIGGGHQVKRNDEILDQNNSMFYKQSWRENFISAGLAFPLNLTSGSYRTRLTIGGDYGFYDIDFLDSLDAAYKLRNMNFGALTTDLLFTRLMQRAKRQVQPRWGQEVAFSYKKALDEIPEQWIVRSSFYFPGIQKTHSFNIEARFKKEEVVNTYRFTSLFRMPRGYENEPFGEIYVAGANYELPLWYPDISLGGVAFLQQVKTNLFYDYSQGERLGDTFELNSVGVELMLDLRLLRLFSMTMGVRYSKVANTNTVHTTPFQFLITKFELQN